ncbi:MAG: hypothetical protein H6978_13525 [Gammaproteobacteria bacterium]|nr:hypothetical protein [Gammaproteobacteria bacterium]
MRRLTCPLALLLLAVINTAQPADNRPGCGAQGALEFICGVSPAEDSVAIDDSPWLLVSGMGFGGAGTLKRIDLRTQEVTVAFPAGDAGVAPDTRHYPDCPGPPSPADFSTVGLATTTADDGARLLYAANDGGRAAVEVFELEVTAMAPRLTWVGCIELPGTNPNAVTALEDRAMAIVSMDDGGPDRMARHVAGDPTGSAFVWTPDSGLRKLDSLILRGGNGVAASPDQQTLYISAWSGGEIVVADRDGKAPPLSISLDFLPDNLKWTADGELLVAGQRPPVARIANCTGNPCPADWLIARIDPVSGSAVIVWESYGTPLVNYATGATEVGGQLYLTTRGERSIAHVPLAGLKFYNASTTDPP